MVSIGLVDPNTMFCLGIRALVARLGLASPSVWHDTLTAFDDLQGGFPDVLIVSDALITPLETKLGEFPRGAWALIVTLHGSHSDYLHNGGGIRPNGLILRSASEARFCDCLQTVIAGYAWLDCELYDSIQGGDRSDWRSLSKRELEVAHLASLGLSNKEIARSLKLSDGTVKIHMHHVFAKLHLNKREQLADRLDPRT